MTEVNNRGAATQEVPVECGTEWHGVGIGSRTGALGCRNSGCQEPKAARPVSLAPESNGQSSLLVLRAWV